MSLSLRIAKTEDLGEIAALMNLAFRGTGTNASWNTEAGFIEGERTNEAALVDEFVEQPESFLLVLDGESAPTAKNSEILGCVLLRPMGDTKWYLGSLTVDPRLQNSGLGRRLLEAAELWAVGQGARTIQMTVVNVRDTLIAWYERRGYRLTGETRIFPYGDDRFGTPKRDDLAFVILEKTVERGGGFPCDAPKMLLFNGLRKV